MPIIFNAKSIIFNAESIIFTTISGEILFFLDADDAYKPSHIGAGCEALNENSKNDLNDLRMI